MTKFTEILHKNGLKLYEDTTTEVANMRPRRLVRGQGPIIKDILIRSLGELVDAEGPQLRASLIEEVTSEFGYHRHIINAKLKPQGTDEVNQMSVVNAIQTLKIAEGYSEVNYPGVHSQVIYYADDATLKTYLLKDSREEIIETLDERFSKEQLTAAMINLHKDPSSISKLKELILNNSRQQVKKVLYILGA